jgi:hypothetical protein
VNSKLPVIPQLKTLPTATFFEREQVIQQNIVYEDNSQRPSIFGGF